MKNVNDFLKEFQTNESFNQNIDKVKQTNGIEEYEVDEIVDVIKTDDISDKTFKEYQRDAFFNIFLND